MVKVGLEHVLFFHILGIMMVNDGYIIMVNNHWLVVWNMAFIFPYIGNFIILTNYITHIFQRGRSTTKQVGF